MKKDNQGGKGNGEQKKVEDSNLSGYNQKNNIAITPTFNIKLEKKEKCETDGCENYSENEVYCVDDFYGVEINDIMKLCDECKREIEQRERLVTTDPQTESDSSE